MPSYEPIPIGHVLNYLLADAFEASGETDPFTWLGTGKTLYELAGQNASFSFYAPKRCEELHDYLYALGLDDLEANLNQPGSPIAIELTFKQRFELIFRAGSREGVVWFLTEYFERDRQAFLATP